MPRRSPPRSGPACAPPADYVILGIGRYTPIKGFDLLLEAVARLPDSIGGRAPRLLMLGAGPLEGPLRARARQADLADRVAWLGWQPDTAPWYRLADVVAFPCREGEPFGNVLFEAWAQGRAVVTTRSRGALASSRHGVDAWQVANADAPALATGLRRLAGEPDLAQELGRQGRATLARHYSRAHIVDRYLDVYQQLAAGR